jgi:hypothetical protein
MKAKAIVVAFVLVGCIASAQTENDDVYFTRKDRKEKPVRAIAKKQELNSVTLASSRTKTLNNRQANIGYTGRTINPDYQENYTEGVASGYFDPNYQPASPNQNSIYTAGNIYPYNAGWGMNRWGMGGLNASFGNAWGMSPYGFNTFNSYGYGWNMYDPWGYNSWNNPYCWGGNSFYGNNWGWGMNTGWGIGWSNGFGNNFGWGNNFYSRPVVVVTRPDNSRNQVYGKRGSRNDGYVNPTAGRNTQVVSAPSGSPSRSGRTATSTAGTTSRSYYQRGWRQDPSINPAATTATTPSSGGSRSAPRSVFSGDWGGGSSTWSPGTSGGGSRSSGGFSGGGGGSRSVGGGSSGGSSGGGSRSSGGTRGRN